MKLIGLKKAAGVTRSVPYTRGGRVQISVDRSTGEILTAYHTGQSWSNYRDSNVVTVIFAYGPMTMTEIRYAVELCLKKEEE